MFDIPSTDDPRIMIPIPLPCPKGRKPVTIRLPRFDYLTEDQYDNMVASSAKVGEENSELAPRKITRLVDLDMLKPFVSAVELKTCEGLTVGQLNAVVAFWGEQSSIPLGEFLASADSSTENTGAPSSTTSTPEAGQGETSDAA